MFGCIFKIVFEATKSLCLELQIFFCTTSLFSLNTWGKVWYKVWYTVSALLPFLSCFVSTIILACYIVPKITVICSLVRYKENVIFASLLFPLYLNIREHILRSSWISFYLEQRIITIHGLPAHISLRSWKSFHRPYQVLWCTSSPPISAWASWCTAKLGNVYMDLS